VITLDLTAPGNQKAEVYEKIYRENLGDIDISVLLNNAGYAHVG
jgi:short-subunit dehydrogenase